MSDTETLIELLERLASSLKDSNKRDTAMYFSNKATKINSITSDRELNKLCKELLTSGAISQYANFSYKEDELFAIIYQQVSVILESID